MKYQKQDPFPTGSKKSEQIKNAPKVDAINNSVVEEDHGAQDI